VKLRLTLLLAFALSAGCGGTPEPQSQSTAPDAEDEAPVQAVAEAAPSRQAPAQSPPAVAAPAQTDRIELAQADTSGDTLAAAGYENGVHYQRLSPAQPTSTGPGQVEVAEFFMYSCIHCYNFEPYVQRWLESKPDFINFVRVPTTWNALVRLHAQAFYTAEALGKGEEMHAPFFRAMHQEGNYMQSEDELAAFFARFDVSRADFQGAFESFSVHTKLQRADELARRYRVSSTPTIVINGKYVTNASMAGGYDQLLELINTVAASERGRPQ
jgi:protein dithiol oxidoreductase (disulfide-forming)